MTCPMCGGDTKIVDSRKNIDNVVRYRKCRECSYRFSTIEVDEDYYNRREANQPSRGDMSKIKKIKNVLKEITSKLSDIEEKYD